MNATSDTTNKMKEYKNKLENLAISTNTSPLKHYVANYWLNEAENYGEKTDNAAIKSWFLDLQRGGCKSGFIPSLIYYSDTHKFFDEYSDDIFSLLDDLEENYGEQIKVEGDRKNFYAWVAFEETARQIAEEIGLEV